MVNAARHWRTLVDTPVSRALGIKVHSAVFRHRDDTGGAGNVVALQIPEATEAEIGEALHVARASKATHIAITCAEFQRVPYERAMAGEFGRLN